MNTQESPKARPSASEEESALGNYFIANYPPFSFWTAQQVEAGLAALDRPPVENTPLGLYLHIPFCRKRCHFCYFRVYTGKNASEIHAYLDTLVAELTLYSRKPFLGDRALDFVYFGGGTPSYLSSRELRELASRLQSLLPWTEAREVTFECEPGTLTPKKLAIIHEIGVTRLSLGIENFDDRILEVNGRAHRSKEIYPAYERARKLGFPQINVDLIAGMQGETDRNWEKCVRKVAELQPDSITIYQMEIPYNTNLYQSVTGSQQSTQSLAGWATKRRWVDLAFSELEGRGYQVTSGYTLVKDSEQTQFCYRDLVWRGADLLSLGVASFSHIGGTHFQNEAENGPYQARVANHEFPIYRALPTSEEERMVRELILQLKLGRVQKSYFLEKFHCDITDRFAQPLSEMVRSGWAEMETEGVRITRRGLLRIDSLLPAFFLPQHQNARYW